MRLVQNILHLIMTLVSFTCIRFCVTGTSVNNFRGNKARHWLFRLLTIFRDARAVDTHRLAKVKNGFLSASKLIVRPKPKFTETLRFLCIWYIFWFWSLSMYSLYNFCVMRITHWLCEVRANSVRIERTHWMIKAWTFACRFLDF